ncbi:MAG: universal stress protein [Oscillochloris sp.]|nr:universal stress protein [Oscillochloris sp.]
MAENGSTATKRTALVVTQDADAIAELVNLTCDLIGDDACVIIVLSISLGAVEAEDEAIAAIEKQVKHIADEKQMPVRSMTVTSTSIARGVLDTAREERADLIVVGTSAEANTTRSIGSVAENIAATTPCRLVIYRRGVDRDLHRVVITTPIDEPSEEVICAGVELASRRARPATLITIGPDALDGRPAANSVTG